MSLRSERKCAKTATLLRMERRFFTALFDWYIYMKKQKRVCEKLVPETQII